MAAVLNACEPPCATDLRYQAQILPGVSRTFALTIPQLPPPLAHIVSNAYLLCRIADTIEDDVALTPRQKRAFAEEFIEVVRGRASAERFARRLHPRLSAHTPAAERDLVANTPRVVRITHAATAAQRSAITRCITVMSHGMARFQADAGTAGLATLAEFDRYCYVVAGVVGEMLTELFCDYSPQIAQRRTELLGLAVAFGEGLQATNILKDLWEDRRRGVCWLPREVFHAAGCDLAELDRTGRETGLAAGLERMVDITRHHLRDALAYTLLIPRHEEGIRRFCLWALGMAALTLRRIAANPGFRSGREVKISRRSVQATVLVTGAAVRRDGLLRLLLSLTELRPWVRTAAGGTPPPTKMKGATPR